MRRGGVNFAAAVLLTAVVCSAESERNHENIIYPLELNFAQEEGTVEIWVRPDADLAGDAGGKFYHFFAWRISLGMKTWGEQGGFGLIWRVPQGLYTFGTRSDAALTLRNTPTIWPRTLSWPKGTWHHLAFTWCGKTMTLYADGERVARSKSSGLIPSTDRGYWVVGYGDSPITVDEFVISSVARSAGEIQDRIRHRPIRDEFTLILDSMESLSKVDGRLYRLEPGKCASVRGRYGQAVQLHR